LTFDLGTKKIFKSVRKKIDLRIRGAALKILNPVPVFIPNFCVKMID